MCPLLSELAIVLEPEDRFGVIFVVDGKPLFSERAGTPVFAHEILCDPSPLTSDLPHRVVLRKCSCGNLDSSASVVISADGAIVRWTDWRVDLPPEDDDGPEPPAPPPLAFDGIGYERVVAEAMARVPPDKRGPAPVNPWEPIVRPGQPGELEAPPAPRPDGAAVLEAVRAAIAREVERVDDPVARVPGGDPSDAAGWHPAGVGARDRSGIGEAYYNAETWRWFDLVDLAYLDELVIIEFRWADPSTPPLRYLLVCHVDRVSSADFAGWVVRSQLRAQLAPGWRDRLGHRWLGHDRVLLWRENELGQQIREAASWSNRSAGEGDRRTDSGDHEQPS